MLLGGTNVDAESYSFVLAILVNIVDQLFQFTGPINVPYGMWLDTPLEVIGLFSTFRGLGGIISNLWLPRFADGRGGVPRRRAAVLVSLVGLGLGYFIQGGSSVFRGSLVAPAVFILGRFVTGLMSGMTPVLSAHISALCRDDNDLMRWRFTALQTTNSSLGVVLAPIAGACAFFSLELPFYINGVSTYVVLVMCWLSFKEATEVVGQPGATRTRTTSLERLSAVQTPKKVVVEGSPWKDPIVWMHCFARGCTVLMMSGVNLLLPTLLAEEGFGLQGDTVKETQQHVSIALGLLNVPSAILSFSATCLLFIPLTKKFGDVAVTAVFGFAMSVAFCSFALLNHSLWMVAFVFSVTGFCRGLVFPVAGPLFATYYKQVFPTQQATAQSAGSIGVCISQLISQVLVARIFTVFGKYWRLVLPWGNGCSVLSHSHSRRLPGCPKGETTAPRWSRGPARHH